MYLYFNKEGKLTTAIPHGEKVRQGGYLNITVCLDDDFFLEKGDGWTCNIELSFPNEKLGTTMLSSLPVRNGVFEKVSDSEVTYDLVDGRSYLMYDFKFAPEQATMEAGKIDALVSIVKTQADLTNPGTARTVYETDLEYFGRTEIYVEKTFGFNKRIIDESSLHYKNLMKNINNLDSRKMNKDKVYEEIERLSLDESEAAELIESYMTEAELLDIGTSEKYDETREDQIPTSKAVEEHFIKKEGDTINGPLYMNTDNPYLISGNKKIGIKAVNKGNGKTVGQVSVNNNVVSMQSIDDSGKEYEIRVSPQGPQYKEGNDVYNLAKQNEVKAVEQFVENLETTVNNEISRSVSEDAKKVNINSSKKLNVSAWKNTDTYVYSVVPNDGNPQLIKIASDRYSGGQTIVQRQNDGNIVVNVEPKYDYHATNKQYVDSLFATISSVEFKVVSELPTTNISKTTIYLKPIQGKEEYEEYIYIENKWEMLGTTQIDLSNYITKDMILTDDELDSILA